jgi:hypothetical protein
MRFTPYVVISCRTKRAVCDEWRKSLSLRGKLAIEPPVSLLTEDLIDSCAVAVLSQSILEGSLISRFSWILLS